MLIKPDGVERRLIGKVIERVEDAGFRIVAMHMEHLTRKKAEELYAPHRGKDFFEGLVEFMISGPVVGLILEKENAIEDLRRLVGKTDPARADVGTIRHDFGMTIRKNVVHASDSPENASREIKIFFEEKWTE